MIYETNKVCVYTCSCFFLNYLSSLASRVSDVAWHIKWFIVAVFSHGRSILPERDVRREWRALRDENEGERLTREHKHGRVIRKMKDLMADPNVKEAGLQEAEVLALQLYTGSSCTYSMSDRYCTIHECHCECTKQKSWTCLCLMFWARCSSD
jgi:hypothetical protein